MVKAAQNVEKLHYKTVEIPKLTRGIARDSTELIGNTPLVRLNRITKDVKAEVVAKLSFNQPQVPIIANTTGEPITTAEMVAAELLRQLCNCVQWQRSIEYMANAGVSTFIEIGPGKVLTGLVKRINKEVKTINIGDLQAIRNLVGQ